MPTDLNVEMAQAPRAPADALLSVRDLTVELSTADGIVRAVDGCNLMLYQGRTTCIVGESGCGKSIATRAILRLLPTIGRITQGEILFRGRNGRVIDITGQEAHSRVMRSLRGSEIAIIFQEPMTSLSPVHTIGAQIAEMVQLHSELNRKEAHDRAAEMLGRVGIPRPTSRLSTYPFQLSGGMRQRAMIAMALACSPQLLIADEPSTALDVTTQAQILDLLRELRADFGMSILFITHDLGVVAEMADEVVVMYLGAVVERANVKDFFASPKHPYSQALLRSTPKFIGSRSRLDTIRGAIPDPLNRPGGCPFHNRCDHAIVGTCDREMPPVTVLSGGQEVRCWLYSADSIPNAPVPAPTEHASVGPPERKRKEAETSLIEITDLKLHFDIRRGLFRRKSGVVKAVDGINLTVMDGETLGIVGESGSGKTTLGRCIVRIYEPTSGSIVFKSPEGQPVDLAHIESRELRSLRRDVRMIFQDPFGSLNPRATVGNIIAEPLKIHKVLQGRALEERVGELLERVGLRADYMVRYPHAFSGGERQRIGIARALALDPRVIICDEPVSALDVSVQAQVLNLLVDLKNDLGLTYIFIAHDLSVVRHICDRVAVMYLGRVVEIASTSDLFHSPRHPYTEALLSAVPVPDPSVDVKERRVVLKGEIPDPSDPPSGCPFHPRCQYSDGDRCVKEVPQFRQTAHGHAAACHYADTLTLSSWIGTNDHQQDGEVP